VTNPQTAAYDPLARLLHWLVFLLLAVQFSVAWTMPDVGRDTRPEGLIAWHLSIGTLILLVIVLRLLWRLSNPAPPPPATVPPWLRSLSRLVHFLLYAILLLLPLMGWGNASSRGWDVTLFGVLPLPHLLAQGSHFGHALGDIHGVTATILLIVSGVHVLAALYHQFIIKDRTLARMLPLPGKAD
jgi:cytochrome b561